MAITTAQKNRLNKMNKAFQAVSGGTIMQNLVAGGNLTSGSYSVGTAEANGSRVVITTGLSAVRGQIVQINRSGSQLTTLNPITGSVAGTIELTLASGSKILPSDIINYIAF